MIAYRLQGTDGVGPWRSGSYSSYMNNPDWERISERCGDDHHQSPADDGQSISMSEHQDYVCACSSIEQFWHWFEDDWLNLPLEMYEICVPDDCVVIRNSQVLINMAPATKRQVTVSEYCRLSKELDLMV